MKTALVVLLVIMLIIDSSEGLWSRRRRRYARRRRFVARRRRFVARRRRYVVATSRRRCPYFPSVGDEETNQSQGTEETQDVSFLASIL